MPSASCDTFLDDIEDIVSQEIQSHKIGIFENFMNCSKVRRRNTQKYLQGLVMANEVENFLEIIFRMVPWERLTLLYVNIHNVSFKKSL